MLNYLLHEQSCAALAPAHAASQAMRFLFNSPLNPHSYTICGRAVTAGCELFEHHTRYRGKPQFNIRSTIVGGDVIPVRETIVWQQAVLQITAFRSAESYIHTETGSS